jgi:hypothetical protein
MAEALAAPLAIAGVQGGWFVIRKLRHSRPKYRLQKWEDKVAKALKGVDKIHSRIKPSDMEDLMHRHSLYCFSISDNCWIPTNFFLGGRNCQMNSELD